MKGANAMKRSINRKTGDAVPVERNLYFVVEKPFVRSDTTDEDEDYSFYKVGDPIVVEARSLERYVESYRDFLNNNCRVATDEEARDIYNELYSNARVGDVYDDGSYQIWRFFIVESHFDELWEKFDLKKENCLWDINMALKDRIIELCEYKHCIIDVCIGYYKGKLFLFTQFDEKDNRSLLKICRRATSKESVELSIFVKNMQEVYRKKFEEEHRNEEEAKAKIYEANKSNPKYYPGVGGNYKQILLEEGKKVVPEKEYSLAQIKSFYQALLSFDRLSDEVKKNIIFYGGTIPYVLCNESGNTRKFGDVDIFLPVDMMQRFRYELRRELDYVYDSIEITRRVRLTAKGFRVKSPNVWWDEDYESYSEFSRRRSLAEMEVKKNIIYQDYGFKAVLFGINISVFPLYDWTFEDGSIGVCAKSFRLSKEKGDWNFLLNTIVSKGITIENFYDEVCILGHNTRSVKTEYTIASKRNAIRFGYILRKDTDEADLEYIEAHSNELGIDESQVEFFMKNIPDYGISYVYRITRGNDANQMSPEAYKHVVTRNDKPS